MTEIFTMAMQFVILAGLVIITINLHRTTRMARELGVQLAKYRREVDWLTARLDGYQGERPNGQGVRASAAEAARPSKAI